MGLLPKSLDGVFGGGLSVGVIFGNGAWLGAQNTGLDSGGKDYQMVVPAGAPLRLWLQSSRFSFIDSAGNAVPAAGLEVPFQAVAGVDQAFTFSVSGTAEASQSAAALH